MFLTTGFLFLFAVGARAEGRFGYVFCTEYRVSPASGGIKSYLHVHTHTRHTHRPAPNTVTPDVTLQHTDSVLVLVFIYVCVPRGSIP